jgi:hypothetical protein
LNGAEAYQQELEHQQWLLEQQTVDTDKKSCIIKDIPREDKNGNQN